MTHILTSKKTPVRMDRDEDSAELAEFRERWKAEVRGRQQGSSHAMQPSRNTAENNPQVSISSSPGDSQYNSSKWASPERSNPSTATRSHRLTRRKEQETNFDSAYNFDNRTLKHGSNEEETYNATVENLHVTSKQQTTSPDRSPLRNFKVNSTSSGGPDVKRNIRKLVSSFGFHLQFEAENKSSDCYPNILPDELFISILQYLEPVYVERFALVCKKARMLTLDSNLWEGMAKRIYHCPQIAKGLTFGGLANSYNHDYRRLYIEHPRLRIDGVYIAVCHYVRQGLGENAWYQVRHRITYHRYLRFMPDGTVLSLLTNEEDDPKAVIQLLRPGLCIKGLRVGTWLLDGTTVLLQDLVDTSEVNPRYAFELTLGLHSRPLGRWNKLQAQSYDSIRLDDGEITPISLRQDHPFWFSKVRSYM